MSLSLRIADPANDPQVAPLIDACFERPGCESRLVDVLARGLPGFDPGLALVAEQDDRAVGWALFLPRRFRIRGEWVPLAIASPFGVLPEARGTGVGRFLMEAGAQALRDRGMRGAVAIGEPRFFERFGFAAAFDFHTVVATRDELPEAGDTSAWRGLVASDLGPLVAMHDAAYARVSGAENRSDAALDWESSVPEGHTLVLERDGAPCAYVRFRVRDALEVRECAGVDPACGDGILLFLRRLLDEHSRQEIEVHVPPSHPIARALYDRGAELRRNHFGGGAMLSVVDWPGLLSDTRPAWSRALRGAERPALSMEIEGTPDPVSFHAGPDGGAVGGERVESAHLWVPAGWAPPLLTGRRTWADLADHAGVAERSQLDADGWALVRRLFPTGEAMWPYSPVFEIADA